MLETEKRIIGTVPVLELRGRFDGHGAAVFEQEVESLDLENTSLVLDVSRVNYVSSMGLRALLKTQKGLKRKGHGVVLASVPPFMQKVLELSGLLQHFTCASGSEEAVGIAAREFPAIKAREEKTLNGRTYRITDFETNSAILDMWGSPAMDRGQGIGPENLTNLPLLDLGIGFGIGGFGQDRDSASQALGEFVAAGGTAAVVPAGPYGEPDYLLEKDPTGSGVFTASAA
ncbi:MAG: STAS domain-containing protein, partial [Desulfobacterales bacterium]|nr:STAS domain-containing protein [Desulfobacterales bacterium]